VLVLALAASTAGCGSSNGSASTQALKRTAALLAIEQIEVKWHHASSTKNVGEMMSLWAPDANFTVAGTTYTGSAQIRDFFAHKAAPFQPQNHWISETPEYKLRVTVNGDKGTLYFECHYVDAKTRTIKAVVSADQDVALIGGRWLITKSVAASPQLAP
jgi:ketosteroid isomerase-like protein